MAEREPITYMAVKGEMENDEDVEASVDGWRDSLKGAESPGLVRAYRLPFDQNGIPSYNAKNQVRLGCWPIDHYTFDELCGMIVKEFMFPAEQQMAVRLIGTRQGVKGIEFNKIVMLQRPRSEFKAASETPENSSGIMKAITDSNERMLRMVQEMRPGLFGGTPDPQQSPMTQMMQFAAMMRTMMEPMMTMMQATMGVPRGPSESPTSMLKGLVETMAVLDGLRGGQGMGVGGEKGDSAASIFRSVADVAAPLLTIAARSQGAAPAHGRRALPAPAGTTPPHPKPQTVSSRTAGAQPATSGGVDLSQPSAPGTPPLPSTDLSQPSSESSSAAPIGQEGMFIQAKMMIDSLVKIAQQGANPKEVAQSFFENQMLSMDDSVYELLCNQLEASNFLDQIAMLNPHVKSHGIFFSELQQALLTLIRDEHEAADTDEHEE